MVNNEEFDQDNLRGTRRWFGRVGLGLIGAVAATLSSSRSASASLMGGAPEATCGGITAANGRVAAVFGSKDKLAGIARSRIEESDE